MKTKKIIYLIFLLIGIDVCAQQPTDERTKDIVTNFLENKNVSVFRKTEADSLANFKFIGYEKTKASQWEFTQIYIPSYVIIDSKKISEKNTEKLAARKLELKNQGLTESGAPVWNQNYSTGTLKKDLYLTDAKFFISDTLKISISGSNNEAPNFFESSITKTGDKFSEKKIKIYDFVVSKFINEKNNKIYYFVSYVDYSRSTLFVQYGVVSEDDFNKSTSEKAIIFKEAKLGLRNDKLSELKKNKTLTDVFSKIFPKNKVYLYDVAYKDTDISNNSNSVETIIHSLAISNINPNLILKSDFPTNEKLQFINFKLEREFDYLELILDINTRVNNTYQKSLNNSNDDFIVDEINTIKINDSLINSFDYKYFRNKVENLVTFFEIPTYINFSHNKYDNSVIFGVGLYDEILVFDFYISYLNNKFTVKKYENLSYSGPRKVYSNYNISPNIERTIDPRVDQDNFKFVVVEPRYFENAVGKKGYSGEKFIIQPNKIAFKDFLAKEHSSNLNEFHDNLILTRKELEKVKEQEKIANKAAEEERILKDQEFKKDKDILIKKFGAKFVNEALNGNIIIGMPEDLLPIPLKLWEIYSRSQTNGGYTLYCKSYLDSSVRLRLSVTNGKVSYISY